MGQQSKIEWTDHTFSPWQGCTKVSPACDHCYAEGWGARSGLVQWGPHAERRRASESYRQQPLKWDRQAERDGISRRVFCASLADVFDNQVPTAWRAELFSMILKTPMLDWLLLTKRPQLMRKQIGDVLDLAKQQGDSVLAHWTLNWLLDTPPTNVWLGTTAENQEEADRRIPHLLAMPAVHHFLSCEPLLGYIDLLQTPRPGNTWDWLTGERETAAVKTTTGRIDWVICGGESGHGARAMHPEWARCLRDQCRAASVAFFFKQWGDWRPVPWKLERGGNESDADYKARSQGGAATHAMRSDPTSFRELGHAPWSIERALPAPGGWQGYQRKRKKEGAARLDGQVWQQFPDRELLTPDEHQIIHNALGLLYAAKPYRTHYCAPAAGEARDTCERLAVRGLLTPSTVQKNSGSRFFHVTAQGAAAVGHSLPKE